MGEAILTRASYFEEPIPVLPDYATAVITFTYPNGDPVTNMQINCSDGDRSLNNTTNERGKCVFYLNGSSTTFSVPNYTDVSMANYTFSCTIGLRHNINLQYNKTRENGALFTLGNGTYYFSEAVDYANIAVFGGGGGGGYLTHYCGSYEDGDSTMYDRIGLGYKYGGGGGWGNSISNVKLTPFEGYKVSVGAGGTAFRVTNTNYKNTNNHIPASSGGTTMFGNIISAIGGQGAKTGVGSANAGYNETNTIFGIKYGGGGMFSKSNVDGGIIYSWGGGLYIGNKTYRSNEINTLRGSPYGGPTGMSGGGDCLYGYAVSNGSCGNAGSAGGCYIALYYK